MNKNFIISFYDKRFRLPQNFLIPLPAAWRRAIGISESKTVSVRLDPANKALILTPPIDNTLQANVTVLGRLILSSEYRRYLKVEYKDIIYMTLDEQAKTITITKSTEACSTV